MSIVRGIGSLNISGTNENGGPGGDFFQALVSTSIATSGNFVLPAGDLFIIPDSNGQIQVNVAGVSSSPSWLQAQTTGQGMFATTDGYILRVLNTSGAAVSILKYIPMK